MTNKFISDRLSSLLAIREISQKHSGSLLSEKTLADVLEALSEFMECVRYLNTRRTTRTKISLDSEADIQDAVYLILRPWVPDIIPENPTDKVANRFVIKDFLIPSLNTVIEIKYIRDPRHGKGISQEINDDIENYRYHLRCENIIFFIYDPSVFIPDRQQLENHISFQRTYSDKVLVCHPIILP